MKFKWRGKNDKGEEVSGAGAASDKFELAREMRARGVTLVSVEPIAEADLGRARWWQIGGVRPRDKIVFANSLSSMISAGLSLARALAVLGRQSANRRFRTVIETLEERIKSGESFSRALESFPEVFPPVFVAMVAAGEESGNLPGALDIVSQQLSKNYELRRKVRGAMIYPAIVITAVIGIGILMMIYLVPNLTSLFKELNVALPLSTRLVVWTSDFLVNYTLVFAALVAGAVMSAIGFSRTAIGRRWLATILLKLPAIGKIAKQVNAAVTMRTLASLIVSGVSMVDSITMTRRVLQNPHYQVVLDRAGDEIQKGKTLSSVFKGEERLFPPLVGELAEVGEETGKLADLLTKGAVFYEGEVDQATKNLSTIVEPLLMIVIGVVVGFFAVSMLGPIYSLSDKL